MGDKKDEKRKSGVYIEPTGRMLGQDAPGVRAKSVKKPAKERKKKAKEKSEKRAAFVHGDPELEEASKGKSSHKQNVLPKELVEFIAYLYHALMKFSWKYKKAKQSKPSANASYEEDFAKPVRNRWQEIKAMFGLSGSAGNKSGLDPSTLETASAGTEPSVQSSREQNTQPDAAIPSTQHDGVVGVTTLKAVDAAVHEVSQAPAPREDAVRAATSRTNKLISQMLRFFGVRIDNSVLERMAAIQKEQMRSLASELNVSVSVIPTIPLPQIERPTQPEPEKVQSNKSDRIVASPPNVAPPRRPEGPPPGTNDSAKAVVPPPPTVAPAKPPAGPQPATNSNQGSQTEQNASAAQEGSVHSQENEVDEVNKTPTQISISAPPTFTSGDQKLPEAPAVEQIANTIQASANSDTPSSEGAESNEREQLLMQVQSILNRLVWQYHICIGAKGNNVQIVDDQVDDTVREIQRVLPELKKDDIRKSITAFNELENNKDMGWVNDVIVDVIELLNRKPFVPFPGCLQEQFDELTSKVSIENKEKFYNFVEKFAGKDSQKLLKKLLEDEVSPEQKLPHTTRPSQEFLKTKSSSNQEQPPVPPTREFDPALEKLKGGKVLSESEFAKVFGTRPKPPAGPQPATNSNQESQTEQDATTAQRSALLDQIKAGRNLNEVRSAKSKESSAVVSPNEVRSAKSKESSAVVSPSDLQDMKKKLHKAPDPDEVRSAKIKENSAAKMQAALQETKKHLKPVENKKTDNKEPPNSDEQVDSLVQKLQRKMQGVRAVEEDDDEDNRQSSYDATPDIEEDRDKNKVSWRDVIKFAALNPTFYTDKRLEENLQKVFVRENVPEEHLNTFKAFFKDKLDLCTNREAKVEYLSKLKSTISKEYENFLNELTQKISEINEEKERQKKAEEDSKIQEEKKPEDNIQQQSASSGKTVPVSQTTRKRTQNDLNEQGPAPEETQTEEEKKPIADARQQARELSDPNTPKSLLISSIQSASAGDGLNHVEQNKDTKPQEKSLLADILSQLEQLKHVSPPVEKEISTSTASKPFNTLMIDAYMMNKSDNELSVLFDEVKQKVNSSDKMVSSIAEIVVEKFQIEDSWNEGEVVFREEDLNEEEKVFLRLAHIKVLGNVTMDHNQTMLLNLLKIKFGGACLDKELSSESTLLNDKQKEILPLLIKQCKGESLETDQCKRLEELFNDPEVRGADKPNSPKQKV